MILINLLLGLLLSRFVHVRAARIKPMICYDYSSPIHPHYGGLVDCTLKGPRRRIRHSKRLPVALNATDNNFQLNLSCNETLHPCDKIRQSFQTAFDLISNVIILKQQISVSAELSELPPDIIGGAFPSRQIPRLDPDHITRLYPQALFKQSGNQDAEYATSDIHAVFNSDMDFWYMGDGTIREDQFDFLYVIVHELMHGLGVTTSWGLLPDEKSLAPLEYNMNTGEVLGFMETSFDRYLISSTKKFNTLYENMSEFFTTTKSTYKNMDDFLGVFNTSDQYSLALDSYRLATTPRSLEFQMNNNQTIVLETNFNGQFLPGSSLTHFDYITYKNSSDFLMTFYNEPGVNINQIIQQTNEYFTSPIGPLLTNLLQTIGYETNPNPRNYKEILKIQPS
ncbi:hypothetical protein K7432_008341 [Basidiobolus ranarum]|uniref:Sequence orphan n=1 Tax=Basidiobolus ranarum TaxID=34480 RepID=A0ABR2WS28_9FUNG